MLSFGQNMLNVAMDPSLYMGPNTDEIGNEHSFGAKKYNGSGIHRPAHLFMAEENLLELEKAFEEKKDELIQAIIDHSQDQEKPLIKVTDIEEFFKKLQEIFRDQDLSGYQDYLCSKFSLSKIFMSFLS